MKNVRDRMEKRARVTAALGSCSFGQIRERQDIFRQFRQMRRAMQERNNKVRQDGKFELWSTRDWRFNYQDYEQSLEWCSRRSRSSSIS